MILAFDFYYISKNGVLEHLLKEIANDFLISHKILRQDDTVRFFVEADEHRLGEFADYLSNALPLSIFFKSSCVEVVASMPLGEENIVATEAPVLFTPKRLAQAEDNELILRENTQELLHVKSARDQEDMYERVATLIDQGECVRIETGTNTYVIGKIEQSHAIKDFEVIATDLSVVERMVVCHDNEMKALASLERPAIRFKVNALYEQKGILDAKRVFMRLSDDLFLYPLCKKLFEKGIFFLFRTDACPTPYSVVCEAVEGNNAPLHVSVLENGVILLLRGMRYASRELKESLKKFDEPSHASFASLMQEHQLFDVESTCFYLSKTHDDRIMHYSKEHGMLNLVGISLPSSFAELFAQIERSSSSAKRLVQNYQEQFPELFSHAMNTPLPQKAPQNIYTLWGMVAVVLGLSKTIENGAQRLIENAEDYGGEKGPRIDYYLEKEDALSSDFDYVRLFRSGMSYKLAGTDDNTLSFGYMESLAYFITDIADAHRENLSSKNSALGGALFGYKRFSEMVFKNLKPNHTICFNRELPIDQ
ncbi:hypothetical protein [Sulfurospirillum barnesii]|uniref:Uncharacterized protein n=1 Tax=Sulfurospirillum barnesii (strain ATCC 700032 / DSM 10660 / SES-3) TaxID=760154 RepID=I3XWX0_SULBS|nr:hypothetical protein [Sulfurospirillum barnesii]AFL68444.1 hypothetical protein Sulba_1148 [Sulfurospirillum barnesii SES-3]